MLRATLLLAVLTLPGVAVAAGPASVWLDTSGRPNASARDALRLLADAPADGLVAADYRAHELATQATALQHAVAVNAPEAQAFDRALDSALLHFVHDLHAGRIDPRTLGFRIEVRGRAKTDFAATLHAAAARQQVPQAVAALRPGLAQYGRLREALAHYRVLASTTPWPPLPTFAPARWIRTTTGSLNNSCW